ncbi:hypothetical protein FUA23_13215 [Neolewinella aurantiaca]|uniref:Uncharacterized protein n=1 Tax=Neolewinella aurantiaca TaxID=2602767 RepID=A0A5C7FRQ6_9BACT|nr:hypothetical protein [Neolewinella aurantiaca]TXF88804.1 hypothetical protein FUA23_13215 [Neolewinella aurantiaca]
MLTPRLKRTLRYCLVLYIFIVPTYYLVYRLMWDDVPAKVAFINSLIFGIVNLTFLGPLHYFRVGNRDEGGADAGAGES